MQDTSIHFTNEAEHEISGYAVVFDNAGVGLEWYKATVFEFETFSDLGTPLLWCHSFDPFHVIGYLQPANIQRDQIGIKVTAKLKTDVFDQWIKSDLCAFSVGLDKAASILVGNDLVKCQIIELSITMCAAAPRDKYATGNWKAALGVTQDVQKAADQQACDPMCVNSKCCLFTRLTPPISMLALKS